MVKLIDLHYNHRKATQKAQNIKVPGVGRVVVYVGVGEDVLEVVKVGVGVVPVTGVVLIGGLVVVVVVVVVVVGVSGVQGVVVFGVLGVDEGGAVRNSRDRENRQRHKAMSGIQQELNKSCA